MNSASLNSQKKIEIVTDGFSSIWGHLDIAPLVDKRIFVTGGTGFFGLWLLSAITLLNRQGANIHVTALSRNPDRFLEGCPHFQGQPWLSFITGNVRDFEFPSAQFDLLIHAATDTTISAHANPLAIFDDIVVGTRRTLDFGVKAGIKRVLLTSSGAVYGPQPSTVSHLHEDARFACSPNMPTSAYGEGKRVMELLGALYHREYGIEPVIARCFAFAGPGLALDGQFAIGNFIRDALYADAIHVGGDGTPLRSYLYGADLAVWLLQLLGTGQACHPYNVGSDQAISVSDLAILVRNVVSAEKEVCIAKHVTTEVDQRQRYVPSIGRAKENGLDVWTSLERAIEWTADFYR